MRKKNDDFTFVSFEIRRDFLKEIDKAVIDEELVSRSSLIRHLLFCWLREVRNSQEQEEYK